ncbi:MAG TPA: three-Cys-motif partner protein TcmP, partial [Anaerohalosphaeraceae bacterium]|nr:three-Cys-motif partner protein TcmP [Anaerohalosphaeraceae bacterium]
MEEYDTPKFDEIGYWSEIKLEILSKYAPAYTSIMSKQSFVKGYYYIDGFSGHGIHKSKTRDDFIQGSPSIALNTTPPFTEYFLIDLNSRKVEHLRQLAAGRSNVHVYEGDCNEILLKKIFPVIKYEQYKRALCLLDPYGLHLNWDVIFTAGQSKAIEIFLNFPVMDMNRNILWINPDKVDPLQANRMTSFWGDESWKDAAYRKIETLFGDNKEEKVPNTNKKIAFAFRNRLKDVAGFGYVPEPIPMRNTCG